MSYASYASYLLTRPPEGGPYPQVLRTNGRKTRMATVKARPKSWLYRTKVVWTEARKGRLSCAGKPDLEVATPPEFGGHEGIWTPEDLFVASVNVCVMATFLYYRAKMGIGLVAYESEAEGVLESAEGGIKFTRATIRPRVVVATEGDRQKAEEALRLSDEDCLISRSMNVAVRVEPAVEVKGPA